VIFQRKHNWIMCWLYTGTFGSFIGFSAGFPLLTKTQFPGGQRRCRSPSSGRWSARCRAPDGLGRRPFGGARVTLWVFV
jgi:NNP family nitrate/nitrite transporter-like MFS transporter